MREAPEFSVIAQKESKKHENTFFYHHILENITNS
jgi:hypothetical protein